jgi:superfamily I DNA/RNA helicase
VEIPAVESLPQRQTFFDDLLPEALVEALGRLPEERFDAIVVDEGQDFRRDWWVALQLGLRDPSDGILYIFYDNNQQIFRHDGGIPEGLASFDLTENLRNTKCIHHIARAFYTGGTLESVAPEGRPVEFVEARSQHEVRKAVSRILQRLVVDEGVAPQDIAILSGRVWERSAFANLDRVGNFGITRDPRGTSGKVVFETVHRFKGLERQVVILTEMDSYVERKRNDLLYVGLTRARLHLVIIGVQSTARAIRGDVNGVGPGRAGQS